MLGNIDLGIAVAYIALINHSVIFLTCQTSRLFRKKGIRSLIPFILHFVKLFELFYSNVFEEYFSSMSQET